MKKEFFCSECFEKFGNNLGKFSTAVGFNLHLSIIHKVTTENKTLKNRPKSESSLIDQNKQVAMVINIDNQNMKTNFNDWQMHQLVLDESDFNFNDTTGD